MASRNFRHVVDASNDVMNAARKFETAFNNIPQQMMFILIIFIGVIVLYGLRVSQIFIALLLLGATFFFKSIFLQTEKGGKMQEEPVNNDTRIEMEEFSVLKTGATVLRKGADYTAPLSIGFFVLLFVGAYFHESNFMETGIIMLAWLVLQIVGSAFDDDFRDNLLWGIISIALRIVFYIFSGVIWSLFKIRFPSLVGQIPDAVKTEFAACTVFKCKFYALLPLLVPWTMTWPMNMIRTFSNKPLEKIAELFLSFTGTYFVTAFENLLSTDPDIQSTITPLMILVYVGGYLVAGYVFTHAKLFFDVWQGTLPKRLDDRVRGIWKSDGSYWNFIVEIKWMVMRWMVIWPFEMFFMIFRHPIRIVIEFVYEISINKYVKITEKAMEWREQKKELEKEE